MGWQRRNYIALHSLCAFEWCFWGGGGVEHFFIISYHALVPMNSTFLSFAMKLFWCVCVCVCVRWVLCIFEYSLGYSSFFGTINICIMSYKRCVVISNTGWILSEYIQWENRFFISKYILFRCLKYKYVHLKWALSQLIFIVEPVRYTSSMRIDAE